MVSKLEKKVMLERWRQFPGAINSNRAEHNIESFLFSHRMNPYDEASNLFSTRHNKCGSSSFSFFIPWKVSKKKTKTDLDKPCRLGRGENAVRLEPQL